MYLNLSFDVSHGVCKSDAWVGVARWHFRTSSLQSWEESTIDWSRFSVLQLLSNVTCHSEIRILIDSSGNKARHSLSVSKYMWERTWESWGSLNCRESKLADSIWFIETEDTFNLVKVDMLLYTDNIRVQVLDVLCVIKDESFLKVESKCNNIFDVLTRHF